MLFPLLVVLFTPSYSIQFLTLTVLIVFCLSFCYSFFSRVGIKAIRIHKVQRTYKNQALEILITVQNRSLLNLHQVFLSDSHGALATVGEARALLSLFRRRTQFEFAYKIKGNQRGEYRIGPFTVRAADPLGLFPWKKEFPETETIIIYPKVFSIHMQDNKGLPCGNLHTDNPVFEDITNYKSLREYLPGDDLRRINWKVSARMGSLYTMQYLPSLHYTAIILLNLSPADYPVKYRYALIEAALETAASLLYHCVLQKQEAGLVTAGSINHEEQVIVFPMRKDESHAVHILETLARIIPGSPGADVFNIILQPGMKIPWSCRIFYVGPAPGEEQLRTLHMLKSKGMYPELFLVTARKQNSDYRMPLYYSENSGISR